MTWNDLKSGTSAKAIGLYLLIWGAATGYLAFKGADWSFPIIAMLIFGLTLSAITWGLMTSRRSPCPSSRIVSCCEREMPRGAAGAAPCEWPRSSLRSSSRFACRRRAEPTAQMSRLR